uniref:Histidinol-phosphatase n=1 Tax=Aureoumbra lagunensis TaxID=44058 RepID=A0A7S3NKX9_9STRA
MKSTARVPEVYAKFAEELVEASGQVILKYWRKPFEIEDKTHADNRAESSSPVTIADREAEATIRRLIAAKYPNHGVIGEEFGPSPCIDFGEKTTMETAEWQWVLDPIDGTKSFMTGKPVFGTLVALCYRGEPLLGVIDQPISKERWIGVIGHGTTLNGIPCKAFSDTNPTLLADALAYATTPDMFAPGVEAAAFDRLRTAVKRMLFGCDCYAYALLASNFGPSIVCEADLQTYDYLALVPVVSAAGGIISDWNGNPLSLHQTGQGRVLAASTPKLHQQALAILQQQSITRLVHFPTLRNAPLLLLATCFGAVLGYSFGRR